MIQQRLASRAKVSLRTIERAEASKRIDKSKLRKIVEVLVGAMEATRLEDELLLYQKFDVKQCDDARGWIASASRFDQRGEFQRAADCVKTLVDSLSKEHPCHAEACICLATFYDHLNLFEEAVEVANRVIHPREESTQLDDSYYWAIYQRGIAFRRMAEYRRSRTWTITPAVQQLLDTARKDFEKVMQSKDERHKVSAKHHLAVLDFHEGEYDKAIKSLSECLHTRQQAEGESPADPEARTRHAYDYRRLGQCCAQLFYQGHNKMFLDRAKEHFSQARKLAIGNTRVLREIGDDIKAFGIVLGSIPGKHFPTSVAARERAAHRRPI
jgi:tetratricopeptide (TPR) repeat protein